MNPISRITKYGFFEFAIRIGSDYPVKPPKVDAKTTNHGRCRFNPNIYAAGKVCLSILGTWQGEKPGEEWSPAQGVESILISIQSLMSNNPYENEPGYENCKSKEDKKLNEAYCAKIRHETIRIAVIQKLEEAMGISSINGSAVGVKQDIAARDAWESDDDDGPAMHHDDISKKKKLDDTKFEPFIDLFKRRFLWWFEHYMNTVATEMPKHKDGKAFEKMPFESGHNGMDGQFGYKDLQKRLLSLKDALQKETDGWAQEGKRLKEQESTKAANIQRQFEQLNENPRFPEEQPRVTFLTPIYHHRVSKDGVLCYFPQKPDELADHVAKVVESIEEEGRYDPRTIVRPEASKLLWSSDDADKQKYRKHVRRSAQDSLDA
ncbi:Ubiquitin-conjugating enzyme E2 Z [Cyphellophora attinorum]|uniref:Ubiquitin-conjugating enzyme E2 Z n=1 Tax=Cyphellophora attinorum TaxID=1664694 RepID=A0A0N1I0A0_9EURO|nr:Ubiquitin-conjugating enzyme E2 Z [Phialophora attinorum]KPI44816.1 Ubiquitin-conjugating enzyme E2 Z [Phialophora attinorum]